MGSNLIPSCFKSHRKSSKENFYILPSSVHECILVPDQGQYSRIELKRMVKEVNDSQVEDEEIHLAKSIIMTAKRKH